MSIWTSKTDAFVRLRDSWVRVSAVIAVEPSEAGSLVRLADGSQHVVPLKPDAFVEQLTAAFSPTP